MTSQFHKKLATGCLVGDGGMGTMLQAAGLPSGTCGELWNVDEPDKVTEIQRCYVEAGSDLIISNTFGGSPHKLNAYGLAKRTEEINAAAARNARRAVEGTESCVLGDIGPSGALLEPFGDMPFNQLNEDFSRQVSGLLDGGVDAFIIETMMDFNEVACAIEAVRGKCDLPIIISLFFNPDKQQPGQFRTMYGDTPASIVQKAEPLDVDIVGSNCGLAIDDFVELCKRFREATAKPLMMQPNAGLGHPDENGNVIYDDPPERMASRAGELYDNGATIVGGCCGTGPEFIRCVREIANLRLQSS